MQAPVLRAARPTDAAAIVTLLGQLGYPGGEAFIERRVEQLLSHPDSMLLVAEREAAVVGVISLHFIPQLALEGDFCRISYLCVAEGERSSGVGALLEDAAAAQARRRGCDRIELHCHERRTQAHRFYARQGYSESPKYLMKMVGNANVAHPTPAAP